MQPEPDFVLYFGSRAGTLFALVLFGTLFALLGWAFAREIRHRRAALLVGLLVTLTPVVLIYRSSLDGFYELDVDEKKVELHYFLSPFPERLPVEDIEQVEAKPAFKLRWRLHLKTRNGRTFESATWNRPEVIESQHKLAELFQQVDKD